MEHIRLHLRDDIITSEEVKNILKQKGVDINNVERISNDTFKIRGRIIGKGDFIIYLLLMGDTCCMEEEILSILGMEVSQEEKESCCDVYKNEMRKRKIELEDIVENQQILSHFFAKLNIVFNDIKNTLSSIR
ncbi:MAG: hypothetical protein OWQ54_09320 [Sulfolobaceae archaeon]|nr:hypothetical protein [Sulfolobaceae archaeon]